MTVFLNFRIHFYEFWCTEKKNTRLFFDFILLYFEEIEQISDIGLTENNIMYHLDETNNDKLCVT